MAKTRAIFVVGTGTEVGKTWLSAFLVYYLQADYWKPVQSGKPYDSDYIRDYLHSKAQIYPSRYILPEPISPHLAAQNANIEIEIAELHTQLQHFLAHSCSEFLIIESAGGLCTPLNSWQTNIDLAYALQIPCLLVSSAYLGCLNHSIASALILHSANIPCLGWVLNGYDNDPYSSYVADLVNFCKLPIFYQIRGNSAISDYPEAPKQLRKMLKNK